MSDTSALDWQQRPATPAQAFDLAAAHHRAGRLDEAAQLYRAVLETEPDHFGALHHLGIVATRQGKLEEAAALLQRAVAADPSSAEALTNLGIALMRLRHFDEAAGVYRRALALEPSNVEAHNYLGAMLHTLGRFEEAAAEFATALRLRPGNAAVHNNLGMALAALGRTEEAVAEHKKAVAINQRYVDAQNNLGNALLTLGRHDEALARLYRALDLTPDAATTHSVLSAALFAVRGYEEAVVHCRRAIDIKPDFAEAHNNLGVTLAALKRHGEAALHYRRAIEIEPDLAEAHNNLGNALSALKRHADAIPHFRRAIEIKPDFAEAIGNLGIALTAENRHDEAVARYERSLTMAPNLAVARSGYANQLMILGRLEEAEREIEQAIALAPTKAEFYRILAEIKRFSPGDPHLAAMQALAGNISELTDDERRDLHFALGKGLADIGHHADAFRHLIAANALKRLQIDYDETAALGLLERIATAFTPQAMRRLAGCGDPSPLPVFIVGMPRSGTTLVEQVLASHPLVFGAGEIADLKAAIAAVTGSDSAPRLAEGIGAMTAEQVRRIGAEYRDRLAAQAPTAQRITDKMLMNFLWIGLIHLALPNARIIHVRRDPADTCLSCFSKLFVGGLPFTYDLAELGRYYRGYVRLMAHWRAVLPEGAMLEVQYEELVTDFPAQARRLVAYCGLEWDERCSAFYTTRRPVATSSATQVRRPIYRNSVGASLPYKDLLRPLLDELDKR